MNHQKRSQMWQSKFSFLVIFAVIGFLLPSLSEACAKSSKSKQTHASLHSSKKAKRTKVAKSFHNGKRRIVPPSRVRIIDTGSKAESETFQMPERSDDFTRGIAAAPKSSRPQMIQQISTPPEPSNEFDAFESDE